MLSDPESITINRTQSTDANFVHRRLRRKMKPRGLIDSHVSGNPANSIGAHLILSDHREQIPRAWIIPTTTLFGRRSDPVLLRCYTAKHTMFTEARRLTVRVRGMEGG